VSSAASRQRQRQRRRARERLWEARRQLAERQVNLVSYERVIIDMTTRRQLSPFSGFQALQIVTTFRDVTRRECDQLAEDVETLEAACKKLEPAGAQASDPKATLPP
jgi:hypothetical protein